MIFSRFAIALPNLKQIVKSGKLLLFLLVAISVAACSPGTESTNSPTDSTSPTATDSASPTESASSDITTTLGVKSVEEINFKPVPDSAESLSGYFDAVNGSSAVSIEVPKATPITANGWAILPGAVKQADQVIITSGENNSLVTVAQVNQQRPDVVKVFNNSAYENSGWSTNIDSSALSGDKVVLKAWAYNAATKEANQLSPTRELILQ